ncbi:efflux transporter outer membrane subunit [Elizabethkingia argentiflava]|uniref:Efflux transporter outer membrane subunit n=1 Tax=Elizabethkingia argenteiflava TaxID=2681556 RepID=A0A845PZ87_9FLAO|nr:TolC family protein [Elizabethkingia argenteiflava]NAW51757.1 efflux transporter outer membrane subunit [Elizabethkingia argenteiflava]
MRRMIRIWIFGGVLSMIMLSCKVTSNYQTPEIPTEKLSRLYGSEIQGQDSLPMASISWKNIFIDPYLQEVIDKVIHNNYDLKIAISRIQQSDAYFKQSQLSFLPSISTGASMGMSKNSPAAQVSSSFPIHHMENYQLSINTGWEIDIWGKLAAAKRAAYADLLASDASKRAVQTQLVAQAASLYYQLLALDKQLAITNQTISIRKKQLETIKTLKASAILTGADVVQSEANLYAAEVSIPDIQLNIRNTENALSLLMGEPPLHILRGELDEQVLTANLSTGIPLQILRNRPDIQMAEYDYQRAFEALNVAQASRYPSLNITAAFGLSTLKIKDLFRNSFFYSVNAALNQVILEKGNLRTQIKITAAQREQAYWAYEKSVINAGNEVSNALYSYQLARAKEGSREKQIKSLLKAVDFNMELLKYTSKSNYTDVLTAEQNLLAAQLAGVNDKLQQLIASINFYRAIGGGQF